jgi:hypothetical protein
MSMASCQDGGNDSRAQAYGDQVLDGLRLSSSWIALSSNLKTGADTDWELSRNYRVLLDSSGAAAAIRQGASASRWTLISCSADELSCWYSKDNSLYLSFVVGSDDSVCAAVTGNCASAAVQLGFSDAATRSKPD